MNLKKKKSGGGEEGFSQAVSGFGKRNSTLPVMTASLMFDRNTVSEKIDESDLTLKIPIINDCVDDNFHMITPKAHHNALYAKIEPEENNDPRVTPSNLG